jgi:hypothetical protein
MAPPRGHRWWAIPEGYLPGWSHGPAPALVSHEALCVLNVGSGVAHLRVTVYFEDREPAGPFELVVPARRTRHFRLNDFEHPERLPVETPFSTVVESDVPVIVQYTRLDSRQAESALLSAIAYHEPE